MVRILSDHKSKHWLKMGLGCFVAGFHETVQSGLLKKDILMDDTLDDSALLVTILSAITFTFYCLKCFICNCLRTADLLLGV